MRLIQEIFFKYMYKFLNSTVYIHMYMYKLYVLVVFPLTRFFFLCDWWHSVARASDYTFQWLVDFGKLWPFMPRHTYMYIYTSACEHLHTVYTRVCVGHTYMLTFMFNVSKLLLCDSSSWAIFDSICSHCRLIKS